MIKKIITLILIFPLFAGFSCDLFQKNEKDFNQFSKLHNQIIAEAFASYQAASQAYDSKKFDEAKSEAKKAEIKFAESLEYSKKARDAATKIPDKAWLVDFKDKVIVMEEYLIQISQKIAETADLRIVGKTDEANKVIDEIREIQKKYEKLQEEVNKIRDDHADFFKDENK